MAVVSHPPILCNPEKKCLWALHLESVVAHQCRYNSWSTNLAPEALVNHFTKYTGLQLSHTSAVQRQISTQLFHIFSPLFTKECDFSYTNRSIVKTAAVY